MLPLVAHAVKSEELIGGCKMGDLPLRPPRELLLTLPLLYDPDLWMKTVLLEPHF